MYFIYFNTVYIVTCVNLHHSQTTLYNTGLHEYINMVIGMFKHIPCTIRSHSTLCVNMYHM